MEEINIEKKDGLTTVYLRGRIDSNNAPEAEKTITEAVKPEPGLKLVLDAEKLEYISSAGLRVILRLRKMTEEIKIVNVNPEIYDILDMTGFTQMLKVEKTYQVVSVEGCEVIGQGANGTVYKIDDDTVVKVYRHADALEAIRHEREVAKKALILGIPTAISYDVVRVGESYGSVFELLNARSFSQILAEDAEKFEWCVDEYVAMLKKIHGTLVPEGDLPDMLEAAKVWCDSLKGNLPEEAEEKVRTLIAGIPWDNHMIHGDYHTKNLELTENEVLLIDMDTLAVGNPVFELASMYAAFGGYGELDPDNISDFLGFGFETAKEFWRRALSKYFETEDESKLREAEEKARVLAYVQMISWEIRNGDMKDEKTAAHVQHWAHNLLELLPKVDSLGIL